MPTAVEIIDHIEFLKNLYAVGNTGLLALNDPMYLEHLESNRGLDTGSTIRLGRKDNSYYEGIDFWEAVGRAQTPEFNLAFMGALLSASISWIGDQLKDEKYFAEQLAKGGIPPADLEYFRHLRNAIAHGNRWNFNKGEPRRPASFGPFVLSSSLQDTQVLFDYMMPGDIFDLLDAVAARLRSV